jgi:nucleoside phosphorylase
MTKSGQSTEISRVDIVVICALSVEFQALSEKLTHSPEPETDTGLGLDHFLAVGRNDLTVLVAQLPDPGAGNVTSGVVASLLIDRYDPWLMVSFGIAGTIDSAVKQLDVVYSKSIFYIDLRKEIDDGASVLKQPVQRSSPLPLRKLAGSLHSEKYKIHGVEIVTSEAVIKSERSERRQLAQSAVADAKAVEMETFGIFQAALVDKESFSQTNRLYLAIKGISDAADLRKSDDLHERVSLNAAEFLANLLETPELEALREKSGIDRRPRPLQPFIRRPPREVLERVNSFSGIVQSIVHSSWDRSSLQAVHMRWRYPRIFYHWRLTGMGLHWVELKFLRVLRRLAEIGYPVQCLIADNIRPMSYARLAGDQVPAARDVTRRIVDAMLASCPESAATFYSEVSQIEELLSEYARRAGYWHEVRDMLTRGDLGTLPNVPDSDTRVNLEFNEWLQYIAWRSRHEGVCIIFHYHDRKIYTLLSWFSGLFPALVPTCDMKLAGRWGKFESPGCELFILPPNSPDIVQWLKTTADPEALKEFWHHLIDQEDLTQEALTRSRRSWGLSGIEKFLPQGGEPSWTECFLAGTEGPPEYYKGAILLELAWLNKEFFASFMEQPAG